MTHAHRLRRLITRFLRREDGAALVEFTIALPMTLLLFAAIVEGSRLLISYQTAIGGVRDAARYLSRVLPTDYCSSGGTVTGYTTQVTNMVSASLSGGTIFPSSIVINSVTPTVACVSGAYRINPAPVATVTANLTVSFPFAGVFSFAGVSISPITANVSDSAKVYGS